MNKRLKVEDTLLTTQEAAAILKVSPDTIRRYVTFDIPPEETDTLFYLMQNV